MRKHFSALFLLAFIAINAMAEGKAKYVFYFIGDGMGVNQVNAAETYLGALEGRIGIKELCFPSFPYAALVNTQSGTNGVTDSAAGGTALATGHKSHNGTIGMLSDMETPVTSIAKWAQDKGAAIGIATTVSIDNATPAAFYAHVPKRGQTYDIGVQLASSGFDFFAGSDFVTPDNPKQGGDNLYQQAQNAGYTIAKGYKDYQKKASKADKMILFQSDAANKLDRSELPYANDRTKSDLTITDITRAAINFLTKKQGEKDGFFLMVEGGKIDHACHANDPATFITELIDMDDAVKVAYEFYQQHPDETLIIVTADHETGGMVMGRGAYELHLDLLRYANMSVYKLGKELHKLHEKYGEKYNIDIVKKFLKENFGLWDKVKLNDDQNKRIETAFNDIMAGKGKDEQSLYQKDDELASTVRKILSEVSGISWASYGHSNGYVPVFAVGVGAGQFAGRIDNTEIPGKVAKAAGWEQQ